MSLAFVVPLLTWWLSTRRRRRISAARASMFGLPAPRLLASMRIPAAAALLSVAVTLSWQPGWQTTGVPTVVVYDVSRSMSATDRSPSRSAAAVLTLSPLIRRSAFPIGLVVFAGDATAVAPVTSDVNAVADALNEVVASGFKPGSGSEPAPALNLALDLLASFPRASIVFVSDGEWTSARGLADARGRASRMLVDIIAVAVGTEGGAPLQNQGIGLPPHVSRLDRNALGQLASPTSGGVMSLEEVSRADAIPASPVGDGPDERGYLVMVLLGTATALLVVEQFGKDALRRAVPPAVVVAAALAANACSNDSFDEGNRRLDAGQYAAALAAYDRASGDAENRTGALAFNRGVALGHLGKHDEGAQQFTLSRTRLQSDGMRALAAFNAGVSLARVNRLHEAVGAFVEALTLDPSLDDARINLTIVRARLRGSARAEERLPDVPVARYLLPVPATRSSDNASNDW